MQREEGVSLFPNGHCFIWKEDGKSGLFLPSVVYAFYTDVCGNRARRAILASFLEKKMEGGSCRFCLASVSLRTVSSLQKGR